MSFSESIKTCMIKKYATMSGRASRSEFWWFQLFVWLSYFCIFAISAALISAFGSDSQIVGLVVFILFGVITLIPYISVFVRRLHDRGLSGAIFWWSFVISIWGVLFIGLIINMFGSVEGTNEYGPNPSELSSKESSSVPLAEDSTLKEEQTEEITDVDI